MTFAQRVATIGIHAQLKNPNFDLDSYIDRKKFFKSKYEEEIYFKKQNNKKQYYKELEEEERIREKNNFEKR